jgi:hypothetical protein
MHAHSPSHALPIKKLLNQLVANQETLLVLPAFAAVDRRKPQHGCGVQQHLHHTG